MVLKLVLLVHKKGNVGIEEDAMDMMDGEENNSLYSIGVQERVTFSYYQRVLQFFGHIIRTQVNAHVFVRICRAC